MTGYIGDGNWTTIGERWPQKSDYANEENPFRRDEAGKIRSPSAISKLIRENPSKARTLCQVAGESLAVWFPKNPR